MPNITSYQRKGNQNQTEDDFMLTRMTKIKNNKVSTEKAMGSWGLSCNCWQGCKMVESLWKTRCFTKKVKGCISAWSHNPTSSCTTKRSGKGPKQKPTHQRPRKAWWMCTNGFSALKWMSLWHIATAWTDLEDITIEKISQTWVDKSCVSTLTWSNQNRQTHRDRK